MKDVNILAGLALLSCADPNGSDAPDGASDTDMVSPVVSGTTGDSEAPPTGEPPPTLPDACRSDAQAVLSVQATPGSPSTVVSIQVELAEPAPVAVACMSDVEPSDIFFTEREEALASHELRLSGLFAASTYSCAVAPVCPYVDGPITTFSYETAAPPSDLRRLTVDIDPALGMTGTWTIAPYSLSIFDGAWIVIWGPDGRPRWWWDPPAGVGIPMEALINTETKKVEWGGGYDENGRSHVVDLFDGVEYAWAPEGWEFENFHHDGKRVEDGRFISLSSRENFGNDISYEGFGIRMHDQETGVVSFDFNSQTLVDAGHLAAPTDVFDFDPYHVNWVDFRDTPAGPQVYASLCFSEQILALDAVTGERLWLLGEGLGWTLRDGDGNPLPESELPQCQHGLEVDSDGKTFLVYDNGTQRGESRASQWTIDGDTRTAVRDWTWTEPGWFVSILGDVDWLNEERTRILVTQAGTPTQDMVEVDLPSGEVASRLTMENGGNTYRSHRYEGCAIFDSVRDCPELEERYEAVKGLLEGADR